MTTVLTTEITEPTEIMIPLCPRGVFLGVLGALGGDRL